MTRSVARDTLPGTYVFGPFRLSDDGTLLVARGAAVTVAPKVLQTLLVLVQRAGQVVTKDDLIKAVWPHTIVEDIGLTRNISVLRQTLGDDGQRFIATVPRVGYRFAAVVEHVQVGACLEIAPAQNSPSSVEQLNSMPGRMKPSIAVLPFQNMSGDSEQDYFTDGMVEDIITGLSRIKWLFVIARNSTFVYKRQTIDVKEVGRQLGVRYVLEGSVRKLGPRIRITAQLIDATNATHVWAERYDRALDDIFALQDEIASSVAGAIAPQLEAAEIGRARAKPTESLDAYDTYLLGCSRVQAVFGNRREAIHEALNLFYRSIELDPEYAAAYGMAAFCLVLRKDFGWDTGHASECAELERLAREGARLAGEDAVALYTSGHALTRIPGQLDAGTGLIARALELDPNLAAAWLLSGYARLLRGEADLAIEHFQQAMRLSPRDPLSFAMHQGIAAAHFLAARYDTAARWAEKSLQVQPNYAQALRMAAASHASAGRPTEAALFIARVCELDPQLRLANLARAVPLSPPETGGGGHSGQTGLTQRVGVTSDILYAAKRPLCQTGHVNNSWSPLADVRRALYNPLPSEIGFGGDWHLVKLACGDVDIVFGAGHFEPGFIVFVIARQCGPFCRERARIVDLHCDIEITGIAYAVTLHDVQFIRMGRRKNVDPSFRVETDSVDNQRVAFPMRHRVAKPARLHIRGVAGIQPRNPTLVMAFIQEDDLFAVIDDLGVEIQLQNVRHPHGPTGFLGRVQRHVLAEHLFGLAADHVFGPRLKDRRIIVTGLTRHRSPWKRHDRAGPRGRRAKQGFGGAATHP